jgi:pyrimidine operon attenuation protein/uracil phosphoribosyltransferase
MARCLDDLAGRISRRWADETRIALVGVHRRGVPFSRLLARRLLALGKQVDLGTVDITQYRDDLQKMSAVPLLMGSEMPFDVDDAIVILCDEVIYTGRTSRAAVEELLDYGRPRCVQFAVLVDRPGRELPIQPDYAGLVLQPGDLTLEERVSVRFSEGDGWDEVFVRKVSSKPS